MPYVENIRVAVLALSGAADMPPFVEHLVLEEKAKLITELKQFLIRRIVRRTYRVHPGLLEEEKSALLRRPVPGRAKHTEIMVH